MPAAVPAKAIIFDIGRVIVRVNLSRLLEPLADVLPSRSNAGAPQQLHLNSCGERSRLIPAGRSGRRAASVLTNGTSIWPGGSA